MAPTDLVLADSRWTLLPHVQRFPPAHLVLCFTSSPASEAWAAVDELAVGLCSAWRLEECARVAIKKVGQMFSRDLAGQLQLSLVKSFQSLAYAADHMARQVLELHDLHL